MTWILPSQLAESFLPSEEQQQEGDCCPFGGFLLLVFLFVLFCFIVIGLFFLDRVSLYKPGWFGMQLCSLGSYTYLCLLSDEIKCLCNHTLPFGFYVLEKLLLDWGIPRSMKKEDYVPVVLPF